MTRRRRSTLGVLAASTLAVSVLPVTASPAAADDPNLSAGSLSIPFREDGALFDRTTGTFGGPRGDSGCLNANDPATRECLPAGASESVLPDGRILYWNAIEGAENIERAAVPDGGAVAKNDSSRALTLDYANPSGSAWRDTGTGFFAGTDPDEPLIPGRDNAPNGNDGSLFCSDNKFLSDGRVIALGGTNYYSEPKLDDKTGVLELEGVRNARAFDPSTSEWQRLEDMQRGRWYPSAVTLDDGDLLVTSGVTKLIKPVYRTRPTESGTNVKQSEIYDLETGTFTENPSSADRSLPLYPRLHLLSNGQVYYGAAGQSFNPAGQAYDQATWHLAAVYDRKAQEWADLGVPGITTTNRTVSPGGFRGSTFQQMLTLEPGEDGRYAEHSFLAAGGVLGDSPGSYVPVDSARIDKVTIGADGKAALDSFDAGRLLSGPRWYPSGVTMPNGEVFVTNGADLDHVVAPGSEKANRQTEIFTPNEDQTGGTWRKGPVLDRDRTYHNAAVLLPTGQVLIGGHAPIPNGYGPVRTNPTRANNHKDASFQIYTPPALLSGETRPVIENRLPSVIDHGRELNIDVEDADQIDSVVLVRNPSVTHVIDADQRVVQLQLRRTGGSLKALVPSSTVVPPGPYMLFLNKKPANGSDAAKDLVPSIAHQLFVGDVEPRAVVSLPQTEETPGTLARSRGAKKATAGGQQDGRDRDGRGGASEDSRQAPEPQRSVPVAAVVTSGSRLAASTRPLESASSLPVGPTAGATLLVVGTALGVRRARRRILVR